MKPFTNNYLAAGIFLIITILFFSRCSTFQANTEFYEPIITDLKTGDFNLAAEKIEKAEIDGYYSDKERLLVFLDKGITYHYLGEYQKSNTEFNNAEYLIEELFTKSISKGIASFLMNDNALDYRGEVYENLYINLFKALNYLHLNKFDDAYVEVNRMNNKLRELDIKSEELIASYNNSSDSQLSINPKDLDYYSNVLAHYFSHLIFEAEGEYDNSRISLEKLDETWERYPDVYNFTFPSFLQNSTTFKQKKINMVAFVGPAPIKEPIGARITTFNDFVTISDPTNYFVNAIPIPGIKYGWNFKFEFPNLIEEGTEIFDIEVHIDSLMVGKLELLENMCGVAKKTFESNKNMVFFKTISRALLKGIGARALGKELSKDLEDNLLGDVIAAIANLAVDATEHADLRSWKLMPGYCFIGEYPVNDESQRIEILFLGRNGEILKRNLYNNFDLTKPLNLIEVFYLN